MAKHEPPPPSPVDELMGDGDWTRNPGWPRIAELGRQLGVDPDCAREELACLFPPDVCLGRARPLSALLFLPGVMIGTHELMLLGHDLSACRGWSSAPNLVAGLRNPDDHANFRFEVGVWAALARHGCDPKYEVRSIGSGKAAEFLFSEDRVRVSLEAKTLPPSRVETNRSIVRSILDDVVETLDVWSVSLRFDVDEALVRRCRDTVESAFEDAIEPARTAAMAWAESTRGSLRPGQRQVPGIGGVVVEPYEAGNVTWSAPALDDDDYRREFIRALRLVREGSSQVAAHRDADVRVVAVNTSKWRAPVALAHEHLQELIGSARDRSAYEALDAIVLINAHRFRDEAPVDVFVLLFPWARRGLARMPWLRALGNVRVIA
jgi:hypothetical protein